MKVAKKGEWFEIEVPMEWEGQTIEEILKDKWKSPKKLTHQFRMEKRVQLNGKIETNWQRRLQEKDHLQIRLFVEEDYGLTPEYIPISIAYEDDHLLIVEKPAGMDTHPSDGEGHTLANAVAYHLQMEGIQTKIRHIHRLDRDTSGGVVFAKHALAGAVLDQMLEKRNVTRTYVAIVHGIINPKKGTINEKIGRDRHHPTRRRVSMTGDHAITHYETIEVFSKSKMSLVKLKLDTGRTHQIRVHLSHIAYPIVGDRLYGGRETGITRQALHAEQISFIHPFTGENIQVKIPWPDDLNNLFKIIKSL